ncbi:MAG TPA: hypothetical protein VFK02_13085 [Kofleriaceae bacterium]|nr:hypothetical protein [Kofleriaceae bacterium]
MANALRIVCSGLFLVAGCGKSAIAPDGPGGGSNGPHDGAPGDVPVHIPGMPGVGAWGLADYHLDTSTDQFSLSTPPMSTSASGSTIVVSIGRGDNRQFVLPTDNKGNSPYQQLGDVQTYPSYPQSGTAVYAFTGAKGGNDFRVSTTRDKNDAGQMDEITIAAIEIVEGKTIQDFAWIKGTDDPLTSASVTTTGPATLIAFWWGDGFPHVPQSATPNNDFFRIATNADERDDFVQCAVAAKNVTEPGTYDVTWAATPTQGAQLWLIAVQ